MENGTSTAFGFEADRFELARKYAAREGEETFRHRLLAEAFQVAASEDPDALLGRLCLLADTLSEWISGLAGDRDRLGKELVSLLPAPVAGCGRADPDAPCARGDRPCVCYAPADALALVAEAPPLVVMASAPTDCMVGVEVLTGEPAFLAGPPLTGWDADGREVAP